MNKKNWKQDFKNNYIFESEMGVHVHFVGQNNDLDIDDFISQVEAQAKQEAYEEVIEEIELLNKLIPSQSTREAVRDIKKWLQSKYLNNKDYE